MLEGTTDLDISKVNMGGGVECCPLVLVTRQQGKSDQDWMVKLPIPLGEMGMRSMVDFLTSLPGQSGQNLSLRS